MSGFAFRKQTSLINYRLIDSKFWIYKKDYNIQSAKKGFLIILLIFPFTFEINVKEQGNKIQVELSENLTINLLQRF